MRNKVLWPILKRMKVGEKLDANWSKKKKFEKKSIHLNR